MDPIGLVRLHPCDSSCLSKIPFGCELFFGLDLIESRDNVVLRSGGASSSTLC